MNEAVKVIPGWRVPASEKRETLADCTAVVPTFNRYPEVIRLLEAIADLPDAPGEVVVIDGAAGGELGARLEAWSKSRRLAFDLVYAQGDRGLTRQRNAGIDVSTRDFLYFFDDDTVPLPGYFARIRQVFAADPEFRTGVVGGCIVNEMDKPLSGRWAMRFRLGLVPRDLAPGRYFESSTSLPRGLWKKFTGQIPVDIVPGGASAWRREVFRTMRFSEYFEGYSQGEDVEASLRAGREWKLACCGDAHILHLHAPGGRPVMFRRGRMDIVNKYFVWKRHTPEPSLRHSALFWLDVPFQIAMDTASWIRRPWLFTPLIRSAGLVYGALECVVRPPRFEEPKPRCQYSLAAGIAVDRAEEPVSQPKI